MVVYTLLLVGGEAAVMEAPVVVVVMEVAVVVMEVAVAVAVAEEEDAVAEVAVADVDVDNYVSEQLKICKTRNIFVQYSQ